MKYIKLFESFEDLGSIKDEIEQMFYDVQDLGLDVKIENNRKPNFNYPIGTIRETIDVDISDFNEVENIQYEVHTPFEVGEDIINSINRLFNWASEYHNFEYSMHIYGRPDLIIKSDSFGGNIKVQIEQFISNYKDKTVDFITIYLRRDIPLK